MDILGVAVAVAGMLMFSFLRITEYVLILRLEYSPQNIFQSILFVKIVLYIRSLEVFDSCLPANVPEIVRDHVSPLLTLLNVLLFTLTALSIPAGRRGEV